jgi:hypothetical protein
VDIKRPEDAIKTIAGLIDLMPERCAWCVAAIRAVVLKLGQELESADKGIVPSPEELAAQFARIKATGRELNPCQRHFESAAADSLDWRDSSVQYPPQSWPWQKADPGFMAAELRKRGWYVLGVQSAHHAGSDCVRLIPSVLMAHELEAKHGARCVRPVGATL